MTEWERFPWYFFPLSSSIRFVDRVGSEKYVSCRPSVRSDVIVVLPAVRLREGMSPVESPGMSLIFAGSQKPTTPRTPSGPRLAVQAAGPSTRPDEAGVTFPRCDILPGIASGRRYLIDGSLSIVLSLSFTPSLSFCKQSGKEIGTFLDHSPGIMTEW